MKKRRCGSATHGPSLPHPLLPQLLPLPPTRWPPLHRLQVVAAGIQVSSRREGGQVRVAQRARASQRAVAATARNRRQLQQRPDTELRRAFRPAPGGFSCCSAWRTGRAQQSTWPIPPKRYKPGNRSAVGSSMTQMYAGVNRSARGPGPSALPSTCRRGGCSGVPLTCRAIWTHLVLLHGVTGNHAAEVTAIQLCIKHWQRWKSNHNAANAAMVVPNRGCSFTSKLLLRLAFKGCTHPSTSSQTAHAPLAAALTH